MSSVIKLSSLASLSAFLIFTSCVLNIASAQSESKKSQPKQTAKGVVDSMDQNGDGKINQNEAAPQLKPYFESIDTNGDGSIDVKEAKVIADYANKQQAESVKPEASDTNPTKQESKEVTAKQVIGYFDKNADGKLSQAESSGELAANFGYIDANHDGLIDIKEVQSALEYAKQNGTQVTMSQLTSKKTKPTTKAVNQIDDMKPEAYVRSLDSNSDGNISKDEAPEDLVLFFDNYDKNADGVIDKKEATAIVAYLKRNSSAISNKPKTKRSETAGKVTAKSIVQGLDSNSDGKISKDESPAQLKAAWDYIDTNKDGFIDVKEAQAMADYQNNQK